MQTATASQSDPLGIRIAQLFASAIEGVIFSVLNKIMMTFIAALSATSIAQSPDVSSFMTQMEIQWVLVYFAMAYLGPVVLAYLTMGGGVGGWGGVFIYTIAWFWIAGMIPAIGSGAPLQFLAILLLALTVGAKWYLFDREKNSPPSYAGIRR